MDGRLRFGPFELDSQSGELRRDGELVPIAPQPFRLVAALVARPGELVTREELRRAVWGEETFVDFERGLNFCVLQARNALGDDAKQPLYIETLPRRGYRFIGAIERPAKVVPRRSIAQQVAIAFAALAIIVVVAAWQRRAPHRNAIAVLPFDNLGGDAVFADGLTDEILTQLSRAEGGDLVVIARASVERYRRTKDVRQVGRDLEVAHVVTGSVRREGDRVRVTAQLVDTMQGTQTWSASFDRRGAAALEIQEDVAEKIAAALRVRLAPQSGNALVAHSPAAHDLYLLGRQHWRERSTASLQTSANELREAIRLDPSFVLPRLALADTLHALAMRDTITPADAAREIRVQADAALRLAPKLARVHATRAMLAFWYDWKFDDAEESYREAIALDPNDTGALHDHGWLLMMRGRLDDGIAEIRRAQELDPLSPRANTHVAWAYIYARRYDDAIREVQRALRLQPGFVEGRVCLEQAQILAGRTERAIGPPLEERSAPYATAVRYALAGQKERALTWLAAARAYRDLSFPLAGLDPKLRVLHGDPRFTEMIRSLGIDVIPSAEPPA